MFNDKKYLASVSGGPDSMALLYKYKEQTKVVCHVNYNLRNTAKRDELIVTKFCNQHKIPLCLLSVNSKVNCKNNFQAWARNIRYDFMCKIAKRYNVAEILIAHNLNDFLETAIMQILNNKLSLFLGIKKQNYYQDFIILRPFINIWKKDLQTYCDLKKIPYGIDESNFSLKYKRNEIRAKLAKWNDDELLYFVTSIKEYNEKNKNFYNKVFSFYQTWKINKFVDDLIFKDIEFIFHVMFEMFNEYNLKFSMNKFKAILTLMQKNNPTKYLRLGNNKQAIVRKKTLIII